MITMNSLAAFTAEVSRPNGPSSRDGVSGAMQVRGSTGNAASSATQPVQRKLEALPAQPTAPLPRGSLLDLRV